MSAQQPLTYQAVVSLAAADPAVVGLVLFGSHAHDGMTTRHSDHDLYVVLADGATTDLAEQRTAELDLAIGSLAEFRAEGMPGGKECPHLTAACGHCDTFPRYALASAAVVLDRLGGDIARILAGKARLDADEAFRSSAEWLDAYANSLYRSVKNDRDGHALGSRLDAADSVRALLELLFALDRRPRPYNKYLSWELARNPLPGWDTDELLDIVDRITRTGDAGLQRRLFARVEAAARKAGHSEVLDAWGDDLELMRPRRTASPPQPCMEVEE
jgi:predicted nucleotidyltransferase